MLLVAQIKSASTQENKENKAEVVWVMSLEGLGAP